MLCARHCSWCKEPREKKDLVSDYVGRDGCAHEYSQWGVSGVGGPPGAPGARARLGVSEKDTELCCGGRRGKVFLEEG